MQAGAGDAAAAGDVEAAVGEGAVVADDDQLDVQPRRLRLRARQPEPQPVARVVFDDHEAAAGARDVHDGGEDGDARRAGEDRTGDRGRQHARADPARVRRLVARAAARDDRDL